MQEIHITHYNLAGKRSDAVVSNFKLADISEASYFRDFSKDVFILHTFVAKLDCPAIAIHPNIFPLEDLRVVLAILMAVYFGKRMLA